MRLRKNMGNPDTAAHPDTPAPVSCERQRVGAWRCAMAAACGAVAIGAAVPPALAENRHEIEIRLGLGYDTNAFRSPDSPYFDQDDGLAVDPAPRSGLFFPIGIEGELQRGGGSRRFVGGFRARGELYPGSSTSNAEETYLRIAPGVELALWEDGSRSATLRVGGFVTRNDEVYFDRDTGIERQTSAGENVQDRFTYSAAGVEAELDLDLGDRWSATAEGTAERRDYERVPGISQLDYDRFRIGGEIEYDVTDGVRLEVDAAYQVRDFDERRARSADGRARSANPPREYHYSYFGAGVRLAPGETWRAYLDLDLAFREDRFVGYNDYERTTWGIRWIYDPDAWTLRVAVRRSERDYDNAFIFDEPVNPVDGSANPKKRYETWTLTVRGSIPLGERREVVAELELRDQDTADPRYAYERERLSAAFVWKF